jgi:tRNA threonylcarbamoyladenosine biosynthesis protein TsaE
LGARLTDRAINVFTFIANDENDTARLGAAIADAVPAGTTIGLIGTLGAGKTRLVQAVATVLGVAPSTVTSPTFVLVNEYTGGRVPVYHFDTYRLKDAGEFLDLGPDEYFDSSGLVFIEWADRFVELLPSERLEITIDVTGETARRFVIGGTTKRIEKIAARIEAACGLA